MRSRRLNRLKILIATILFSGSVAYGGDWRQHQSSLMTKKSKISALEGEIRELIHHKKTTENQEEIKHIVLSMSEKHTELTKVSGDYRTELLHVRFKHPDKGDETERKYTRYNLKTLKEMESEFGLDAKLDRIRKRLETTYGMKKKSDSEEPVEAKAETHVREPAQENRPAEADERIHLSK